jgi:uncharacterized protein (DUF3820 family)
MIVMPFGKYKGQSIDEIPTDYLDWLIGQDFMIGGRNRDLAARIAEHLNTRRDWHDLDAEE